MTQYATDAERQANETRLAIIEQLQSEGYTVHSVREQDGKFIASVTHDTPYGEKSDEIAFQRRSPSSSIWVDDFTEMRPEHAFAQGPVSGIRATAALMALAMGSPHILSGGPFRRSRPSPYSDTPDTNPECVRRNESCPCGSGRKFKRCCKGKKAGAR